MSMDLASIRRTLADLPRESVSPAQERHAAVSMILREPIAGWGAEILLIQRAEHPKDPWSGHMAFPGGRWDLTDDSLRTTAERETHEEIGLDLKTHGDMLGRMPDIAAIAAGKHTGMHITPHLYALHDSSDDTLALTLNPREVAACLWVPLAHLADPGSQRTMEYNHEGRVLKLPCIHLQNDRVLWGLTLQMTHALLMRL
ncbi:MAG: CoA pyrophosphatase [Deltaproteobacteria bacterium]|nr:CoA pyrophosphatase [Deltaproteobacteria bacterium]